MSIIKSKSVLKPSRLLSRLFLILTLMLVVGSNITITHPAMAAGTTYYVAKNGSDSNTGAEASPWLTIQKAANSVTAAGSTVYVKEGTYHELVSFTHGGAAGSPITYSVYPGDTVIVDATGMSVTQGIFHPHNVAYMVFDGFSIQNAHTDHDQYDMGVFVVGSSCHDLIFQNLTISGCYSSGIMLYSGSSFPVSSWMKNVTLDNITVSQCGVGVTPSAAQEMISLLGVDGFEIKNCTVITTGGNGGNTKEGIDIKEGCKNGSVHDCEVSGAVIGLYIDGGQSPMNNVSAYRNKLHDNHYEGLVLAAEDGADLTGINVYNNLIYNNKDRGFIVENYNFNITFNLINNTFYNNTNAEIAVYNPDAVTHGVIRNNIVSSGGRYEFILLYPSGGTHTTIDHNVFYNPYNYTGQSNTFGTNAVQANPLFVNASGGDFRLQSGSPAINAGVSTGAPSTDFDVNSRPQNGGYDAGAFEYSGELANQAPVLNSIGARSVVEGETLSFTVSATDADGDTLTYSASNLPDGASFNTSTRTFSWTPEEGQAGTYTSVHFQVSDGSATDSENITITVNSISANQAPVLSSIGNKSVNEGSALSFTLSATDADGDTLTYSASNLPSGASFNTSTRAFSWTPGSSQVGTYTNVHFQVSDGSATDSENITITVGSTNQAPVLASIGNKSVNEGSALSFTLSATDANDDTLTYSASNLPSGASFNASTRVFSWTPSYTQAGSYTSVHFEVTDGSLTDSENITLTVNNVNRAPVLNAIGDKSTSVGSTLTFTVSAADADGGTLTYSASNLPSGASFNTTTRAFTWAPGANQTGTFSAVHFEVSDGSVEDYENITITVNSTNSAPVLAAIGSKTIGTNELLSFNILASDAQKDTLTYSASNLPSGASFDADERTFSWKPTSNQVGTFTNVHFEVSDGSLKDSENITITVSHVNHAPALNKIGNKTVAPESTLTFTVSASDEDNNTLTYFADNLPDGAAFNTASHTFSWTPSKEQVGSYTGVNFQVNDGTATDSEQITIRVGTAARSSNSGGGGGSSSSGNSEVSNGVYIKSVTVSSNDGSGAVTVEKGTSGIKADGKALEKITVSSVEAPESTLENKQLVSKIYDFGPDGTTFSQPVTITIAYDPANLPDGVIEGDQYISTWNDKTESWENLPSEVNTTNHTISAKTAHFSIYSVMVDIKPATFTVSHINVKPSVVKTGEPVDVSALVTNEGGVGGTYNAILKMGGQEVGVQDLYIDAGTDQTVYFEITPEHTGIYSLDIGGQIGQLEVQQAPEPVFVTEDVEIVSDEVLAGEEEVARMLIANTGNAAGTLDVVLKVNDVSEGFQQVKINAGEFKEVVFTMLKSDPGTYTVDINGKTASFTVLANQPAATPVAQPSPAVPTPSPAAETEFSLSMLAKVLGVGFLLILGTVAVILMRRRQLLKNS